MESALPAKSGPLDRLGYFLRTMLSPVNRTKGNIRAISYLGRQRGGGLSVRIVCLYPVGVLRAAPPRREIRGRGEPARVQSNNVSTRYLLFHMVRDIFERKLFLHLGTFGQKSLFVF